MNVIITFHVGSIFRNVSFKLREGSEFEIRKKRNTRERECLIIWLL